MKNNLFTYATSELSQDAFICWLMSYAMPEAKKEDSLRTCAVAFIKGMIPSLVNMADEDIFVTEIQRQYKKIDVLLTINGQYKVIIEDKIFTGEHSNQLERYKELLMKEGVAPKDIYGVYYKTGFEGITANTGKSGYAIFDRKSIISILQAHKKGVTSDIFLNYLDFYEAFENDAQKYRDFPVAQWDWKMIQGFFNDLKKNKDFHHDVLDGAFDYGYVPNPSGGFYGMWLFPRTPIYYGEVEFNPYLQLEFNKGAINICFKLCIENEVPGFSPSKLKNIIVYNNMNEWIYNLGQFGFHKPSRLGSGKTMTIGTVWKESQDHLFYRDVTDVFQDTVNNFDCVLNYCKERVKEDENKR